LNAPTPHDANFRQPAEWELHQTCWLAFPSHADLWMENLAAAQQEFIALCQAIVALDGGETLEILVLDEAGEVAAQQALAGLPARFHRIPFGDIWLRDIAPIFLTNPEGKLAATRFMFNGWGEKYILSGDEAVAWAIVQHLNVPSFTFSLIAEGGALEVDGEGTCLTTRQCLLNTNRNPSLNQAEIEQVLQSALGVTKILWVEAGLLNDHTDGHIDTIARFVAPGVVVCMEAHDSNDPNQAVLADIAQTLSTFTDAKGRTLQVVRIPSPGRILDSTGEIMPASYTNFYISNTTVVVPTYGSVWDAPAVESIAALFPTRRTIGLSAKAILEGGGAFHCITQQQPIATLIS